MNSVAPRPSVGVSACLTGRAVRYDGGHKAHEFVTGPAKTHLELHAYCPEDAAGLGTPRPPMNLYRGKGGAISVLDVESAVDRTGVLREAIASHLQSDMLDGYILKSRSPSCGQQVPVHDDDGHALNEKHPGVFASALLARHPTLPTIEEHLLADTAHRRAFIRTVFAHAAFRNVVTSRKPIAALMLFHERYKYLLMAQHEKSLRELGPKVAHTKTQELGHVLTDYARIFFPALNTPATDSSHVNALQHMAGYLRGPAEECVRKEVQAKIDGVLEGHVDIAVPTRLIADQARRLSLSYLENQVYLFPGPHEAALLDWAPTQSAAD